MKMVNSPTQEENEDLDMCNHKYNGEDCALPALDGSGYVYCPICGAKWDPYDPTKALLFPDGIID